MRTKTSLICGAAALFLASTLARGGDDSSLWKIQQTLAGKRYVDLTHEFAPGIPRWPGFPDETRKTIYWIDLKEMILPLFVVDVHRECEKIRTTH